MTSPPIVTLWDSRSTTASRKDRMRASAAKLRAKIAGVSAGMIVALAPPCAEGADQEPERPAATRSAIHAEKQGLPSEAEAAEARAFRRQTMREWWSHARETLVTDVELSAEQERKFDAIIGEQLDKRAQLQKLSSERKAARESRDTDRIDAARDAIDAIRAQLKQPHEIYDEMRAVLSEEQRPQFDMSRARHVAENQAPAKERRAAETGQTDRGKSTTR
jgi:hypothetical protein